MANATVSVAESGAANAKATVAKPAEPGNQESNEIQQVCAPQARGERWLCELPTATPAKHRTFRADLHDVA